MFHIPRAMTPLDEPLLTPERNRYVVYPIRHHDVWSMYKKQLGCLWTAEELDLSSDKKDWDALTKNEQFFLKHILAFFAASDGIVMENITSCFIEDVSWTEAKIAYGFQAMMEGIHAEVYSLLIDSYISDDEEKTRLLEGIETIPCVAKKAEWAMTWNSPEDASFAQRLIAFACVEGIFFSGSFCAIYWIKQRGILQGLTTSNEFIARDEGLHTDFACLLYSHIKHKLPQSVVHSIVREAVDIETEFICEAIPCSFLGMNTEMMTRYIQFVADRICMQLGYKKIYNVANPFSFMERLSLEGKDNFFEKRSSSYAKAGVGVEGSMEFSTDAAF